MFHVTRCTEQMIIYEHNLPQMNFALNSPSITCLLYTAVLKMFARLSMKAFLIFALIFPALIPCLTPEVCTVSPLEYLF